MPVIEAVSSDFGSDRSANCAATLPSSVSVTTNKLSIKYAVPG